MQVENSKISMISVVWFIPIIAIITGVWLSYSYYRSLGTPVTLYIANAEGLQVDSTVLKVLNVEVGKIKSIQLANDAKGVVMKAYINSDNPELLAEDAIYWVVKPRIGKGGVSGLSTLVSGAYIEIMPGKSHQKSNSFKVQDRAPITSYQSQGKMVKLVGKNNKSLLAPGSAILYHGMQVGTVEYSYFDPTTKTTNYQIFITSPNEELLGKNVNYWISFGVTIDTQGGNIKVEGLNFDSLVGSISFSEPEGEDKGAPIGADDVFPIYNSREEVPIKVPQDAVYLVAIFDQDVRNLKQGSVVEYKGIAVGRVAQSPYFVDSKMKQNLIANKGIPVLIYVDPYLLSNSKEAVKNQVAKALKNGLVATISSDSVITGTKYIYLYEKTVSDAPFYPQKQYNNIPVIPTTVSGVQSIIENINLVLAKIDKLPMDKTLSKLNQGLDQFKTTLGSVNTMLGDLNKDEFGKNVNDTLKELNQTLKTLSPNNELYQDLSRLMKNLEVLSNKLNEKPSSLIFNYKNNDPKPKAIKR